MVNQNEITLAGFVVCSVKMPLPLLTRHFVEKKLSAYCQQKVPAHILHQVRLTFVVDGSTVTLIEARHTHAQPGTWVQRPIARFLFIVEEMPCVVSVLCKVPESICCAPVNRLQRA